LTQRGAGGNLEEVEISAAKGEEGEGTETPFLSFLKGGLMAGSGTEGVCDGLAFGEGNKTGRE